MDTLPDSAPNLGELKSLAKLMKNYSEIENDGVRDEFGRLTWHEYTHGYATLETRLDNMLYQHPLPPWDEAEVEATLALPMRKPIQCDHPIHTQQLWEAGPLVKPVELPVHTHELPTR